METAQIYLRKFFPSALILLFLWFYSANPMVVTVNGSSSVQVPATSAALSFSIVASDGNPQTAISNVNAKALSMRTFLKGKGIAEGDIAESQVTAVPASAINKDAQGFQATIVMAVKTVHVTALSTLVSEIYGNGASVVSQPILTVEDKDIYEQKALNDALKDAKKAVGKLAKANWKFLRKIAVISQNDSSPVSSATTKQDLTDDSVFRITKTVTVTYKLW